MKFSLKKCGIAACLTGALLLTWINLRTVEMVAVHQDDNFTDILVHNFPLTDKGKIGWWLEHADELKAKYGFPRPGPYGLFSVSFWDFKDGYKEDAYDLLCFSDMKKRKIASIKISFLVLKIPSKVQCFLLRIMAGIR